MVTLPHAIVLESLTYVYPFKTTQVVKPEHVGVLQPYYKRHLTKEEGDDLIYLMLRRNPCVDGAMSLHVIFDEYGTDKNGSRYKTIYLHNTFNNYCISEQHIGNLDVHFNFG